MDLPFTFSDVDGVAGLAALVNGLILWPVVRGLQAAVTALRAEVADLKAQKTKKRRRLKAR